LYLLALILLFPRQLPGAAAGDEVLLRWASGRSQHSQTWFVWQQSPACASGFPVFGPDITSA